MLTKNNFQSRLLFPSMANVISKKEQRFKRKFITLSDRNICILYITMNCRLRRLRTRKIANGKLRLIFTQ